MVTPKKTAVLSEKGKKAAKIEKGGKPPFTLHIICFIDINLQFLFFVTIQLDYFFQLILVLEVMLYEKD